MPSELPTMPFHEPFSDCINMKDFIWQVHRRGPDEMGSYPPPDKSPLNIEVFNSLLESFEAKKK